MENMILTLHVVACLALIVLVLLQSGKEGMGVIFGGGGQSMFGSSGAGSLLAKVTAFLAAVFFVTSLSYNVVTGKTTSSESGILNVQIEEKAVQDKPLMLEEPAPEKEAKEGN